MAKQSLISKLNDNIMCDDVARKRDGTKHFMFRKGYFYRQGTPEGFQKRIENDLKAMGLDFTVVDCGDHWAPFKGSASVAKSSHYWVEVKITE